MSFYATGVYRPTSADMKLPDTRKQDLSMFSEVHGLKRYESANDGLIEQNVAVDIATGTGTNISKSWQKSYGNVSYQGTSNASLAEKGHTYFAKNTGEAYHTVYLPTS